MRRGEGERGERWFAKEKERGVDRKGGGGKERGENERQKRIERDRGKERMWKG